MKHIGDICKMDGAQVAPVDVIIGGSPCQDLSVAGKKAGLAGERSGLFMEQIRIIKEMRVTDEQRAVKFIRPRFMVWENVPGAFCSNKGGDFRTVLEETAKIVQPDTAIPEPPKGKWRTSGCIMGDRWSIAWRVLDAQFWGVPQRRRRIALVADFGGHAAPEILFVRESLCWDIAEGAAQRETSAAGIGDSADETDGCLTPWDVQSRRIYLDNGTWPALYSGKGGGHRYVARGMAGEKARTFASGRNAPLVFDARGNGNGKTACTLTGEHQSRVTDYTALVLATGQANAEILHDISPALNCNHEQPIVAERTVRRLTPLECERLQGYPDGWTDIGAWTDSKGKLYKESSDTARYKALGNSIALPPWRWVLLRLAAQYYRPATLGSLFDGIGGFPLIWEGINGKGSCLWASEVDEFCIAVTKRRFGEVKEKC